LVEPVAFIDQLSSWLVILRVVGFKYFGVERKALKCSTSKIGYPLAELSRGYVSECSIGQPENGEVPRELGFDMATARIHPQAIKSLRSLRKFGS
jgi:hypothetical protein